MTRARLRGGAIVAALKNRKTVDMLLDPTAPCVALPYGCNRLKLSLDMRPRPHLRVSPGGLHATIERQGIRHHVAVPWWSVVSWRAR